MKIISTLLLFTFFSSSAIGQALKLTGGYSLALPRQEMGENIQPAHSLQAGVLYQLPGALKHLSVGTELGIGGYANKRIEQTFQFDNNTSSVVPVNYNSNVFNVNLQTRWDVLGGDRLVSPYVQAKGGMYNFFSNIYVEDPEDPGGCTALQKQNIINDKTLYWSAGGGIQVNTGIFRKDKTHENLFIDLGANWIQGGDISYINTKHLMDVQETTNGGKPMNIQFVNASTQQIHEHSVAQVYTTPLRMLEFRLGIVWVLK